MDPTPGCSSHESGETNTVPGRTESIQNLDDIFRVRHGLFKWSVENISTFPKGYDVSYFSPNFALGETLWYLAFCPHSTNSGRDVISLALIRCRRDPGPENAVASYALGLQNSVSKVWFKSEENILFKKGNHHGLQTSVLGNLLQNFVPEDDTVSVVCEIYVSYLSKSAHKPGGRISPIDQTLSSDLAELFNRQKLVDVLIEIRNHRIGAHKSILFARSRTLARLLENGTFHIQLSCNISCLMCALLYMYSGSFSYLARKAVFNIGLYELACELSLCDLREMLAPHKTEKVSRVEARCFKKTCTIYQFELAELSRTIETPEGFDRESGMSVKLTLYLMNGIPESVGINVEVSGVLGVFHVEVNVSFLNKNCRPSRAVPARFSPDSTPEFKGSTLFCSFVISTADVLSSVTDGTLLVNVECTKYYLRNVSDSSATSLWNDSKHWIEGLSSDLKQLLVTAKMSDINLLAKRRRFKVHRSILAARTHLFHELFYEKKYDQPILGVHDTEPRTLELILAYIYCGTISHARDLTIEDFSILYKVSLKCRIPSMVELCTQFLNL